MSFELKDFVSELTELLREFSLLTDANVFYDNTTYYYRSNDANCDVEVSYNTSVSDYISCKCDDIEGLVFVWAPSLYFPCGDEDRDFHDDLIDLTNKYNLGHEMIDNTTFYIYQD